MKIIFQSSLSLLINQIIMLIILMIMLINLSSSILNCSSLSLSSSNVSSTFFNSNLINYLIIDNNNNNNKTDMEISKPKIQYGKFCSFHSFFFTLKDSKHLAQTNKQTWQTSKKIDRSFCFLVRLLLLLLYPYVTITTTTTKMKNKRKIRKYSIKTKENDDEYLWAKKKWSGV